MRSQNNSPTFSNKNTENNDENDKNVTTRISTYCTLRSPINDNTTINNNNNNVLMTNSTIELNNQNNDNCHRDDMKNYKFHKMSKNVQQSTSHHLDNNYLLAYHKLQNTYHQFNNNEEKNPRKMINYGLSNDLSTESLRLDCLDLSGDEEELVANLEDTGGATSVNLNNQYHKDFINHKEISLKPISNRNLMAGQELMSPVASVAGTTTGYKNRQQTSTNAMNNYLLEKLENRLADLNQTTALQQTASSSGGGGGAGAGGSRSNATTIDRKKYNSQQPRDHFHPYCTLRQPQSQSHHDPQRTFEKEYSILNNNQLLSIKNNQKTLQLQQQQPEHQEKLQYQLNINENQLQDPFTSITNQESMAEAYNILNELDAILANNDIISSSESIISSRPTSPQLAKQPIPQSENHQLLTFVDATESELIEHEQIENCLLELDNYLDEIDRQSPKLFLDDNYHDSQEFINENDDNYFKRSNTLPKKFNNDQEKMDFFDMNKLPVNNFMNLERHHELRNTISGQKKHLNKSHGQSIHKHLNNNRNSNYNNEINTRERFQQNLATGVLGVTSVTTPAQAVQPRKTWRRNSMRKTALLTLPEQQQQQQHQKQHHHHQTNEDFNNINLSEINSSIINDNNNEQSQQFVASTSAATAAAAIDSTELVLNVNNIEHTTLNNDSNMLLVENIQLNDGRRCLSQNDCTQLESLEHLDIINDILNNSIIQNNDNLSFTNNDENNYQRPRQIGRRAEQHPRLVSITTDTNDSGHRRIIVNHDRPMSAPVTSTTRRNAIITTTTTSILTSQSPILLTDTMTTTTTDNITRQHQYISSELSSVGSSRNPSPVSLLSSTGSSSIASLSNHGPDIDNTMTSPPHISRPTPLDPDNIPMPRSRGININWPHDFSRILALLSCTLGLFNISRFAILTIHYGGNFLIQFFILSIIFGIPMLWLQMCLGSKIKSGPISMWKITPICRGIGIALCLAQCMIALYTTISLSWVLVYFRDSFVRKHENYKWQDEFYIYRRSANISGNLTETIPDYFNGIVLQRWQLGLGRRIETGGVRFQLAFNLAIIWTGVFLVLCKGLKSYGKIVLGLTVLPLVLFIIITCKFLYIIDFSTVQNIFSGTDFEDFLANSKTWIAAGQETFLTWVLLGPSVISMCSRSTEKSPSKTVLRRDAILVVLLTLFGLSLAAIFGYACIQILLNHGYLYFPGSYEHMDSYLFLYSFKTPIPPELMLLPTKWAPHYSSVLGDIFRRPLSIPVHESGYQPLRLITEIFPAVVAVAQDQISSVWTVLGYLAFLIFGLAHLCAMWKPISGALGNSSSSVLLSCVTGLLLGIPFATEMGLSIIHFLDLIIGGAWWILILWTAQILGVFLIRGRPYNGDVLVNDLRMSGSMSAFLALSWNVLLPIGLVALAMIQYRISGSNQFFYWRGKSYFHFWARKVGGLIQISFLLLMPITAIIQIYRYLSSGPPDILDRIQLLYRPTQSPLPHHRNLSTNNNNNNNLINSSLHTATTAGNVNNSENQSAQDDAPPKYTPPPSYTTATGARLAKMLRQSIRRSVRRILGEPSRSRPILRANQDENSLPPEYSTVLSDPAGSSNTTDIEIGPRALYNSYTQRTLSLERERSYPSRELFSTATTLPNRPASASNDNHRNSTNSSRFGQNFTALDVAQILRTSAHRHERSASALAARVDTVLRTASLRNNLSRSAENLVLNAAPLGQSSAIVLNYEDDMKNINSENTSVI